MLPFSPQGTIEVMMWLMIAAFGLIIVCFSVIKSNIKPAHSAKALDDMADEVLPSNAMLTPTGIGAKRAASAGFVFIVIGIVMCGVLSNMQQDDAGGRIDCRKWFHDGCGDAGGRR